jgi:sugar phosphate isomerase/epimerase
LREKQLVLKLACQENIVPGATLLEKWDSLVSAGYDAIELRGHGDFALRARLPELRAARRAGVVMPVACVIMDHFIGDFDAAKRRDAVENMKSLLSIIAELGGYGAVTPAAYALHSNSLPPFRAPRSPADDRAVLLEGLQPLGEHAAREGVCVLLEPLNRYGDYMLNRLDQAVDLCRAIGLPSLRVVGDFFHMNIEERDMAMAIRSAGNYVQHMHAADSNRLQPGRGHIHFAPSLRALAETGFDHFVSLECNLAGDPQAALAEAACFLRSQASNP